MQTYLEHRCRMNVAITRAKELLIVVGNGSVLRQDPYWKGFLLFTIRNKLFVMFAFKLLIGDHAY